MKTKSKVIELVKEYREDPNCWPSLWIEGENLTSYEKMLFITLALINN